MNSIELAKILTPLIKNETTLSEEDARYMALFVAGFATIESEEVKKVVRIIINHSIEEILALLQEGKLPIWLKLTEPIEN